MDIREKNRLKAAEYRRNNPEKIREISRRSQAKARLNPDKVEKIREVNRQYREKNRQVLRDKERERRFGITRHEYAELFHNQNGVCAICFQPENATRNGKIKALAVDHDHTSGKIRGLLCADCNMGIGKLKENKDNFLSAIKYLHEHKEQKDIVVKLSVA